MLMVIAQVNEQSSGKKHRKVCSSKKHVQQQRHVRRAFTKRNSTQFIMIYLTSCFEMLCCLFVRVCVTQTNLCFFVCGLNGRIDSFHRGILVTSKNPFYLPNQITRNRSKFMHRHKPLWEFNLFKIHNHRLITSVGSPPSEISDSQRTRNGRISINIFCIAYCFICIIFPANIVSFIANL